MPVFPSELKPVSLIEDTSTLNLDELLNTSNQELPKITEEPPILNTSGIEMVPQTSMNTQPLVDVDALSVVHSFK